jgi:hypothetical protein
MNDHPFRFSIYYEVPRRGETPAVIGVKFLHTLDALSRIDPLLARWKVLDRPTLASVPLADARPRIATIVEDFVVLDDDGQPEPESGYSAIGMTDTAIPSRIVEFSVGAGGLVRDEMMLHAGGILHPTDPLIVKYSLFLGALLATTAIWQPTWACCGDQKGLFESADHSRHALIPFFCFPHPLDSLSATGAHGRPPAAGWNTQRACAGWGIAFHCNGRAIQPKQS